MKIYRIEWYDNNGLGQRFAWEGTKAAARVTAREVREHYAGLDDLPDDNGGWVAPKVPEITIVPVDFPTKKAALVRWLNANLDSDNG